VKNNFSATTLKSFDTQRVDVLFFLETNRRYLY